MTLHTSLKTRFENKYLSMTEQVYYWTAKDASNLKKMIAKIEFSFKAKYNRKPTEQEIENSFSLIMDRLPQWYTQHLNVPLINSHYNEIIQQIKSKAVRELSQTATNKLLDERYKDTRKDNRGKENATDANANGNGQFRIGESS